MSAPSCSRPTRSTVHAKRAGDREGRAERKRQNRRANLCVTQELPRSHARRSMRRSNASQCSHPITWIQPSRSSSGDIDRVEATSIAFGIAILTRMRQAGAALRGSDVGARGDGRVDRRSRGRPAAAAAGVATDVSLRRRSGHARRDPAHLERPVRAQPRQGRLPGVRRRRRAGDRVAGHGARRPRLQRAGAPPISPPPVLRKASSCRGRRRGPTLPAASSSCSSTICTSPPPRRRWSGRC